LIFPEAQPIFAEGKDSESYAQNKMKNTIFRFLCHCTAYLALSQGENQEKRQ
jgi:hypothetical protein